MGRVKPLSGQVTFRPAGKRIEKGSEVVYYDRYGDPVCRGTVQNAYEDETYSLPDNCERLDRIGEGTLVGAGGDPEEARRFLREWADESQAARERAAVESEAGDPRAVPVDIRGDRFEALVLDSATPVLLEVYADWCPAARRVRGKVEELARRLSGKMRVVTLDYDSAPEKVEKLDVTRLPAFLVLRKGVVLERWTGMDGSPAPVARRLIERYGTR